MTSMAVDTAKASHKKKCGDQTIYTIQNPIHIKSSQQQQQQSRKLYQILKV